MSGLHLGHRLDRAARALGYIAISLPLAILAFVVAVALLLGAVLSVVLIGMPIVLAAAAASRWVVQLDRHAANRLLGTQVPPLPEADPHTGSLWRRSLEVLSDRWLWRIFAALAVKPVLAVRMVPVALAPLGPLAEVRVLGVQGLGGLDGVDYVGPWSLSVPTGIGLVLFALPT